jgi:hypothetical protein
MKKIIIKSKATDKQTTPSELVLKFSHDTLVTPVVLPF